MNRILFALLLAAQAVAAGAQEVIKPGDERFSFMLGGFLPAFKTKMNVDNDTLGSGSRVDLKDDLGVDQDTSGGWFGAEWRFAQRHRIGLTYSRFTLRGERSIERTLQIGDEQFPVGATLSSQLRLEMIPITYSYSIMKRERDELALTAGLHWSRLSFAVQGSASLGTQDISNDASAKANVPLPLLGVRYDHHFSERWSAGGNLGVFSLRYGKDTTNFEGELWSARLHAEYRFAKHLGIGAAIDGFKVSVEASQNQWKGGFDYGYWGPQLYLTARF
jgi:hypothetical protein